MVIAISQGALVHSILRGSGKVENWAQGGQLSASQLQCLSACELCESVMFNQAGLAGNEF